MEIFAKDYYSLGINPTCVSYLKTKYNSEKHNKNPEKAPCHSWKKWQVRRPSLDDISNLNWEYSNGIGAVLGHSSRCIDIDNCHDLDFIRELLKWLRLPEDYEWVVKTPNGFHVHLQSEPIFFATSEQLENGVLAVNPNSKNKGFFSQIELRWANHIILPPTKINGKKYTFINTDFPKKGPAFIGIEFVFKMLVAFCGIWQYKTLTGSFEAKNMIFKIACPSTYDNYLECNARLGSLDNKELHVPYNKLPMNKKAGSIVSCGRNFNQFSDMPKLFIDTETTGLINDELDYENYPRIIQFSSFDSEQEKLNNVYITHDELEVSPEIENLTGISNAFLKENGKGIHTIFKPIHEASKRVIIGHNIDFDLSVIDSEFIRIPKDNNGTTWISSSHGLRLRNHLREGLQLFCTMKKFSSIYGGKYPKLSEMYSFFFEEEVPENIHNSEVDVKMLVDCYYIMKLYGHIIEDHENGTIK